MTQTKLSIERTIFYYDGHALINVFCIFIVFMFVFHFLGFVSHIDVKKHLFANKNIQNIFFTFIKTSLKHA